MMTPDRFDDLVRSLILARSRRAVLGVIAGGLAALGGVEATIIDAKKKHHHKNRKRKRRKKRKKKCKKQGRVFCKKTCCPPGDVCASGTCVTGQGTCQAGDDACLGINPFCFDASGQHQCICQTRLEGGTRCGVFGNASQCDQCETDADCLALGFPPGSSCTQDFGGTCVACQDDNKGICTIPCGSPDPTT
jgi:hypothetical protein